jgi:NAD(P)-dependent dehydrogenase (short-subunit alcohol dehydrogenase family)
VADNVVAGEAENGPGRRYKGRFEGRVALVTGASRGIGLAIAHRVVAEGGRVVITGRSADTLQEAVAELARTAPWALRARRTTPRTARTPSGRRSTASGASTTS